MVDVGVIVRSSTRLRCQTANRYCKDIDITNRTVRIASPEIGLVSVAARSSLLESDDRVDGDCGTTE
jgi:hypothetical protein